MTKTEVIEAARKMFECNGTLEIWPHDPGVCVVVSDTRPGHWVRCWAFVPETERTEGDEE